MEPGQINLVARLRSRIADNERRSAGACQTIPFGVPAIDARLNGGLSRGALHEVTGSGFGGWHGAAATLWLAGVLGRTEGPVLWCLRTRDLFAPALAGVGLHPD